MLCLSFMGCMSWNEDRMNLDLDRILGFDLNRMVADTKTNDSNAVLDKPYYRVDNYILTKESYQFGCRVDVAFYYLKTIRMKQIRKYRFSRIRNRWERYYKEMEFNLAKPRKKGI